LKINDQTNSNKASGGLPSGFLVDSKQYQGYAERLASWGYVVLTYDKIENLSSIRNDVVTACFIQELIDWVRDGSLIDS
jgi:hypothetical protein